MAHKTKTRRSRGRTHSGRRRFTRIKRGGMMRLARTLLYHDILPLLSKARVTINIGRDPTPDEHAITKENERVYETILGIPVDDGIKESIKNLREELENPVKTADKWSSILKAHHTIIKKLEEEKKKQLAKQTKGMMVVGKAFIPSPPDRLIASGAGVGAGAASGGLSPIASFINPPFSSPKPERYPVYSTATVTPAKPPHKSETRPPNDGLAIIGTPLRPFELDVSITSPKSPPPLSVREKKSNFLLSPSPSPGPYKQLKFDDATTLQP